MSERRRLGQKPYEPTAARTGGFQEPQHPKLPVHLQHGRCVRTVLLCKAVKLPTGCHTLAAMGMAEADLMVVDKLHDLDFKDVKDTHFVPGL